MGREKREGEIQESLGEWDGWDGGRVDMGAERYISQLREPF